MMRIILICLYAYMSVLGALDGRDYAVFSYGAPINKDYKIKYVVDLDTNEVLYDELTK